MGVFRDHFRACLPYLSISSHFLNVPTWMPCRHFRLIISQTELLSNIFPLLPQTCFSFGVPSLSLQNLHVLLTSLCMPTSGYLDPRFSLLCIYLIHLLLCVLPANLPFNPSPFTTSTTRIISVGFLASSLPLSIPI